MKHSLLPATAFLLLTTAAWAQAPSVTALSPGSNAPAAPPTAPVRVTFSQPMSAGGAGLAVFGALHGGRLSGPTAASGNALSFQAARSFQPGETVSVTIPAAVQSSAGIALGNPKVFQFTAAATGGTGTFGPGGMVPSGTNYTGNVVGDVDGDGDLDLVMANFDYNPGTVDVRLNNGSGLYSAGAGATVGGFTGALSLADVDNDGDLDLLACNGSVSVRLNNGQGVFSGSTTVAISAAHVIAADLDGDGDLDLAAAGLVANVGTVSVALNAGGSFGPATVINTNNRSTTALAVGDMDNDGDLDVLSEGTNANVAIRLNNGDGTFAATPLSVPVNQTTLRDVLVADVDNDGDLDVLAADLGFDISVCLNNGAGSFGSYTMLPMGGSPSYLSLADVEGDGDLDMVAATLAAGTVNIRLYLNNGLGTFTAGNNLPVGPATDLSGLDVADADGDGDLDLLVVLGRFGVKILLNANSLTPSPALTVTALAPARNAPSAPRNSRVAVTFNQTPSNTPATRNALQVTGAQRGRLAGAATLAGATLSLAPASRFFAGERVAVSVTRAVQSGAAFQAAPQVYQFTAAVGGGTATFGGGGEVSNYSTQVFPADVDNDGDLDIVTSGGVSVNSGNGTFARTPTYFPSRAEASGLVVADVDGDGDLDIVSSNGYGGATGQPGTICATLNNGNGTFGALRSSPVGRSAMWLVVGDVDGDGLPDAVTANDYNQVGIALGAGNGTFGAVRNLVVGFAATQLHLVDVDNDGDLDLMLSNSTLFTLSLNDGFGAFGAPITVPATTGGLLVMADIDNDGDLDLLTASTQLVNIMRNNGSGVFTSSSSFSLVNNGLSPQFVGLVAGDVDGDGDLDLIAAGGGGSYSAVMAVRLNNGTGTFSPGTDFLLGSNITWPSPQALADLDGDGDLDLMASTWASGLAVRFNLGTPTAARPATGPAIGLYPNPAHDVLNISLPFDAASGGPGQVASSVELLNTLGQVMSRAPLRSAGQAAVAALPVNQLARGLYLVRVRTSSGATLTKTVEIN
ncbi:FG-GAP-like repeat-containing protein [Hymenobacter sp. M29]|uniref:FG-GAP-like repeat-containing protein n=1 Tax=Hymenobacter mellowenesis TaxID=3063995 RepID=A0ABT9A7I4_9BACT|nr:FG-GAP-like repeat-containing protein [Hymenobacter sp. M29]MDO7845314.1 FG-GAP-like repeat-containing protein [Hymenobacter sp. M29]